jgi:hypothetical protein
VKTGLPTGALTDLLNARTGAVMDTGRVVVTAPVETGAHVDKSLPLALAVQLTVPGLVAVSVQVKVTLLPADKLATLVGDGPEASIALPVPDGVNADGDKLVAVTDPALVTVRVAVIRSPTFTGVGFAVRKAVRLIGRCTANVTTPVSCTLLASVPVTTLVHVPNVAVTGIG